MKSHHSFVLHLPLYPFVMFTCLLLSIESCENWIFLKNNEIFFKLSVALPFPAPYAFIATGNTWKTSLLGVYCWKLRDFGFYLSSLFRKYRLGPAAPLFETAANFVGYAYPVVKRSWRQKKQGCWPHQKFFIVLEENTINSHSFLLTVTNRET